MTQPKVFALLGAECTGKSTLCADLAQVYAAMVVPEYLRTFVATTGRVPAREDQAHIMASQISEEDRICQLATAESVDRVIADPAVLMTAIYSIHYFQDASLLDAAIEHNSRYTMTIWCRPDIPWQADANMRDGPAVRARVDELIAETLQRYAIPVVEVGGSRAQRLDQVARAIGT